MPAFRKPQEGDYLPYFGHYIELAIDREAIAGLEQGLGEALVLFARIDEEKAGFRYADDKWSIKELLGHLIDTERLFSARALRLARGDSQPMPGFDQDAYEERSGHHERSWVSLVDEFRAVRHSTLALLRGLPDGVDGNRAEIDGTSMALCAIPWILIGHVIHHTNVLQERYGLSDA